MSDSFQGTSYIELQPGSSAVPYTFTFAAASSTTANDGSIPYNTTISSIAVKAFSELGADVTSQMLDSSSVVSPVVTVTLDYPVTTGEGRYSLEILLTLNTGAVMEFDFTRIYAKDIVA